MRGASTTPATPDVVRCSRCGHTVPFEAWRALPRERTLTEADVNAYVNAWPRGAVVEVRSCVGCGASIARRARTA